MSLPETKLNISNLFPVTKIDFVEIADFWNSYKITNEFKSQTDNFDTYILSNHERWDLIAQQFYNDRELWWIIPLFNDIEDPFALYFDKDIPTSIQRLRILKSTRLSFVLNDVRERLVKLENIRLSDEEKQRKRKERERPLL
jgi:hypothetical protein